MKKTQTYCPGEQLPRLTSVEKGSEGGAQSGGQEGWNLWKVKVLQRDCKDPQRAKDIAPLGFFPHAGYLRAERESLNRVSFDLNERFCGFLWILLVP